MQTSEQKNNSLKVHKGSTPQSKLLVIERKFDVPVNKLFDAFSASDAIKAWWWPKDLYADRVEFDFREGGKYFINLKGYKQADMKGSEKSGGGMVGVFDEIVDNERIVMSDEFADENGKAISAREAHMDGLWPGIIYITFEFESVDQNKSRFVLSQEGVPNEMQKDCIQGWGQSFDKLESYLGDRKQ